MSAAKRMRTLSVITLTITALLLANCSRQSDSESGGLASRGPLEMVVPFEPGGSSDALARVVADVLGQKLDREVVVVNKAGAGGAVGVSSVANNSNPSEVLFTTKSSMVSVPALRDVEFSPTDFELIAGLARQPLALVVPSDSPYDTIKELGATDRRIRYGHSGVGAFPDVLQGSLFRALDVTADGVPFNGNGPAITALIGGQVDSAAAEPSVMNEYVDSGDARYLGIFAEERLAGLPDVPTFRELGVNAPAVQQDWYLLASKGTDESLLAKLRDAAAATVEDTKFKQYLDENLAEPLPMEPQDWPESVEKEAREYVELLDRAGLKD